MTGGQIDVEVVRTHLAALDEALTNLRRHVGRNVQELREDADLRWTIERGLHLCVQNALDIASHIVAANGLNAPDYASAIDRLAEIGVISADFAARLRPLAGFRNVLVHGYLQVDLGILETVLKEKLPDLSQFATDVQAYLVRSGAAGN